MESLSMGVRLEWIKRANPLETDSGAIGVVRQVAEVRIVVEEVVDHVGILEVEIEVMSVAMMDKKATLREEEETIITETGVKAAIVVPTGTAMTAKGELGLASNGTFRQ
eukprot:gi/632983497/ref/XP_007908676.1/ PREDICTED: uncharacterized protein LOC103189922 [Callorhinchus milii]